MKPVEEAFASDAFRRVILPGIVVWLGVHPLIATLAARMESLYGVGSTLLLIAEVIFFGLVISSPVQPIYYVYEGFALQSLTAIAGWANKRRVRALNETLTEFELQTQLPGSLSPFDRSRCGKTYERLLDFPVRLRDDGMGEHYCERPTRLGNIIATYELYPKTRYGIDGVFYWFHLLHLAPENSQREFAGQYAFAESLVLASFSGALVAILHLFILIGFGIGKLFPNFIVVVLHTGPKTSASLMVFGVAIWAVFYAAALPAHREAGKQFQSIVDAVMPCFVDWISKARAPLDDTTIRESKKVWKYLGRTFE